MILLQSTYDLLIFYADIQQHYHHNKSRENYLHYFIKYSSKKVKNILFKYLCNLIQIR